MAQDAAEVTSTSLQSRIDAMFARDRLAAGLLVAGLWLTVFFVMLAIRGFIPTPEIEIACWIGAGLLLLFNTASIFAMIQHYANDKLHIYAVDIKHLDVGR